MPKGPLGLPRLTNLGPLTEESEQVGNIIFRGANIHSFNNDEFTDNTIDGRPVDVWYLDTEAAARRYDIPYSDAIMTHSASSGELRQAIIDEFRVGPPDVNRYGVDTGVDFVPIESLENEGLISRKLEEDVTGGLSTRLGSGIRFAGTGGTDFERQVPLVMLLEKNRIPARLVKVEYDYDFINEHPAIAGAAASGGRMLFAPDVNDDGTLGTAKVWYGVSPLRSKADEEGVNYSEDELVVKWFDNPLEEFKRLEPERELFAYTDEINLDHALFGLCIYIGPTRLENMYAKLKGERKTDIDLPSVEDQAREVHRATKQMINSYKDRLVLLLADSMPRTGKERISRSNFRFLYDGEHFTRNYNKAIPFTHPGGF